MFTIDREAAKSVRDQIVEQLRYQIASGQIRVGSPLPSTRSLARQLGVSFHTVRLAYQALEQEAMISAKPGTGYVALNPIPRTKADRMERGASLLHEALRQLVGLGCDENEISSLFHEQLDLLEETPHVKVVMVSQAQEVAELCAQQVTDTIQRPVQAASIDDLELHRDADFIVAPCDLLRLVLERNIRCDALAVTVYLHHNVLERTARLLETQSIGLVTGSAESIPVFMAELRKQASFDGNILAVTNQETSARLAEFARQADLLLYTPACRRRLQPVLDQSHAHAVVAPVISAESLEAIRMAIPA